MSSTKTQTPIRMKVPVGSQKEEVSQPAPLVDISQPTPLVAVPVKSTLASQKPGLIFSYSSI